MSEFNAYHSWLGISSEQQAPNYYQLLGIAGFEKDRSVIIALLDQRQKLLQGKLAGPHSIVAGELLEVIQKARLCLLNRLTKAHYDSTLRQQEASSSAVEQLSCAAPQTLPLAEASQTENHDLSPIVENGFEFPEEDDFKPAPVISKRTVSRSGQVSWAMNLIVLCCFLSTGWWLVDRGFLPQLKTLLHPTKGQQVADDSSDVDAEDEIEVSRNSRSAVPDVSHDKSKSSENSQIKGRQNSTAAVKNKNRASDTERFASHQAMVVDFAVSADGQRLATTGPQGDCRVWDLSKGETTASFTGHEGNIHAIAISPDGAQVLTSGETLKLWNANTGDELAELNGYRRPSRAVQFLHGGQQVATVGSGAIEIWDLSTQKPTHSMSGAHPFCGSLAMTADNQIIAAATGAQTEEVTLFEPASGKAIRSFVDHQARVSSIAMSKDGTSLWAASGEHKARRWNTKSETSQAIFAHADVIALSPDETMLVTCGLNGLVTIWNAQTGSVLLQLPRQKLRVLDIAFLPDGEHVLFAGESTDTSGQTATIQLWQLPKLDPNSRGSRPNAIPVASSRP